MEEVLRRMELALRLIQGDPHQWSDSGASAPASRTVTAIAWANRAARSARRSAGVLVRARAVLAEDREGQRVPDKTDRTTVELLATRATSGAAGSLRRDVARAVMPARQEPLVDAEPHGGPPTVGGPDRVRPQPPQVGEAGERALDDPGLRQTRPLVPIHVPGRERAG